MATKYSQAGYNFSTSSAEISGVAHKICSLAKHAKNTETVGVLNNLKKLVEVLDTAIKVVVDNEPSKALANALSSLRQDYNALTMGIKAHLNSPEAAKKTAATDLKKRLKMISEIFYGKQNTQLGNIKAAIELLKKATQTHFTTLGIKSIYDRLCNSYTSYIEKYSEKITDSIDSKEVDLEKAKKSVLDSLRLLKTTLDFVQTRDENDEKFVVAANEVWKAAKLSQSQSKAAKDKAKKSE